MDIQKLKLTGATVLTAFALSCGTVGCNRETRSKTDTEYSSTTTDTPAAGSATMSTSSSSTASDTTVAPTATESTTEQSAAATDQSSASDTSTSDTSSAASQDRSTTP
jgi:hypothetical protein